MWTTSGAFPCFEEADHNFKNRMDLYAFNRFWMLDIVFGGWSSSPSSYHHQ
ncbi:MAG: hypothetical protein JWQ49_4810 [Edaphobacter sp.]|nr:hypothetical protein [Edaphobacter sp.]